MDQHVTSEALETPQVARRSLWMIYACLMLVMFLSSLDQTIVSTALPTIAADLGGLAHLSWVVTSYMIATTVAAPLYGKLGDLYGRKIMLQAAIVIFLTGSAACGLSQNMLELILFRAAQGLGGGGLIVTVLAVVGDVVPPRDRGRYQGAFGAVFALSSVLGPLIGGFFVEELSWRWIFYVNLPLGGLALPVIAAVFPARTHYRAHRLDWAGGALLSIALTAAVLFTSTGGTAYAWGSAPNLMLGGLALAGAISFALVEFGASEPILPPSLFTNQIFAISTAIGFFVAIAFFGSITFVPLYLQLVRGSSPSHAGMQMVAMMGGMLASSIASGQIISRWGRYKAFPITGTVIITVGMWLLSRLGADAPDLRIVIILATLGLGLGMVMQVLVIAVQNGVAYTEMGVATSGSALFRMMGGSIGVSVFGTIFAGGFQTRLAAFLPPDLLTRAAQNPLALAGLPLRLRGLYAGAVASALQPVFVVAAALAGIAFVLALRLPEKPLRR